MGSIPINHLGNYAKPLKCLNDQVTYDLHVQPNDIWTYPLSVTKCLTIQVTDQGTGRATFSVDHIDNTKARVFGAGGRIPRIFMIGTI